MATVAGVAATNTASSSGNVNAPASIAVGDLLIAILTEDTASTTVTVATFGGGGWTAFSGTGFDANGKIVNGTLHMAQMLWKIADAGDVGASTFSYAASAALTGVQIVYRITGADGTTPIDVASAVATASATTHTTNSITPSAANQLLMTHYCCDETGNATWTQPTGTEEVDQTDPTAFVSVSSYAETYASAAAVTRTGTVTTAKGGTAIIWSIKDAAGGGTPEAIAGTVTATSTVAAALTDEKPLAATVTGQSAVTPALSDPKVLAAAIAGQSAVTAALTIASGLRAQLDGVSTASAVVDVAKKLAAQVDGLSVVAVSLSDPKRLAAQAAGVSSVADAVTDQKALAALAAGRSNVVATLTGGGATITVVADRDQNAVIYITTP